MESKKYTCGHCGGVFQAAWSEEEAIAEMKAKWGTSSKEGMAQICDNCYNEFMKWYDMEVS